MGVLGTTAPLQLPHRAGHAIRYASSLSGSESAGAHLVASPQMYPLISRLCAQAPYVLKHPLCSHTLWKALRARRAASVRPEHWRSNQMAGRETLYNLAIGSPERPRILRNFHSEDEELQHTCHPPRLCQSRGGGHRTWWLPGYRWRATAGRTAPTNAPRCRSPCACPLAADPSDSRESLRAVQIRVQLPVTLRRLPPHPSNHFRLADNSPLRNITYLLHARPESVRMKEAMYGRFLMQAGGRPDGADVSIQHQPYAPAVRCAGSKSAALQ